MQAWDNFLLHLDEVFGKSTTDKWVRNLKIEKFDACNIYLSATDSFQANWIKEHIIPLTKSRLLNNNGHEIRVHISSPETSDEKKEEGESKLFPIQFYPDPLTPHCIFEQYFPIKENQISFEILCRIIGFDPISQTYQTPPEEKFNPLFIYGPTGIGKTHLLMSAAHFLQMQGLSVFYVHAETFTDHVVNAIRSGNMQNFRKTYRNVDVLIVDDIGVIARKNATQEELFHTFNTLHTMGKQIILSGHINPRLLEYIEDRLISRFEWGLTIPFEKGSYTQILPEILKKRTGFYNLKLKKTLADFLLKHFHTPTTLCQAIEVLARKSSQYPFVELSQVETILNKLIEKESKEVLTPEKIIEAVAFVFDLKKEDILSKSQMREVTLPRQMAMYLMRTELKLPYMRIGEIFQRDHSTVMTAIKQIQKGVETNDSTISYHLNQLRGFFAMQSS